MIQVCGFEFHLGQLAFSLKKRESEPSQVMLSCCLALFDESQSCHVMNDSVASFMLFICMLILSLEKECADTCT